MADQVRSEVEYSWAWIVANPALYQASLTRFLTRRSGREWHVTVDASRPGFITYIATARTK